MFDPRSDIKGLFTDYRVTGTDKYSNTAHVDIYLAEDNPNATIVREGVIILEQPRAVSIDSDIGDNTNYDEIKFDANLFVIRKSHIRDYPSFINSIVNTFQSTIKTNRSNLSSCSDAKVTNMDSPLVPFDERKVKFRRVIEITCWKLA